MGRISAFLGGLLTGGGGYLWLNFKLHSHGAEQQRLIFDIYEDVTQNTVDPAKRQLVDSHEKGLLSYGPLIDFKDEVSRSFRNKWNSSLRYGSEKIKEIFTKKEPIIITQSDKDITENLDQNK